MANQPLSNEQLASLLLDGELSGNDLAQANLRLSDDAEFAAEVASLRGQRELFKSLPVYKTPDDFSERTLEASVSQVQAIMGEFATRRATVDDGPMVASQANIHGQGLSGAYAWRTAIAAVASLAGMILLTLFVFPGDMATKPELANLTMGKAAGVEGIDSGSAKLDLMDNGLAEQVAGADLIGKGGFEPSPSALASRGGGGFGGAMNGGGASMKKQLVDSEVEQAARSQQVANAAPRAPQIKGGFSGMPMSNTANQVAAAPAVEQIWYVDLDNPNRALASVGEILVTNEIQVQSADASAGRMQRRKTQADESQNAKSGFEAFYVSATQSQMKQALIELSDKADISTLPIAMNSSPQVMEMSNALLNQGGPEVLQESNERQQVQQQLIGVPPSLERNSNQAMAQQLVQMPLNRRSARPVPPVPNSDDPALNKLAMTDADADLRSKAVDASSGSADDDATKSDSTAGNVAGSAADGGAVGQKLAKGSGDVEKIDEIASEADEDKGYFDDYFQMPESDAQLRQYLILVRTPDAAPSSLDDDSIEPK